VLFRSGKYQDWLLPNPAEFYCCLFRAMGRLAAWDKLGRYDAYFGEPCPVFDEEQYIAYCAPGRRDQTLRMKQITEEAVFGMLDTGIDYLMNVVRNMMPSDMLNLVALKRIQKELSEMSPWFADMSEYYQGNNCNFNAAMHQNLQADNAFFWRDEYGDLECGVLDWGGFTRAPFCQNFLGCLSGTDIDVMMAHEEGIVRCFRDEYHRCGGPYLEVEDMLERYHLAFITMVYNCCTWIERDIYKTTKKEDIASWSGVLDDRFQANFRVRCRSMTVINAWTYYHRRGSYFKDLFDKWSKGRGKRYLTTYA